MPLQRGPGDRIPAGLLNAATNAQAHKSNQTPRVDPRFARKAAVLQVRVTSRGDSLHLASRHVLQERASASSVGSDRELLGTSVSKYGAYQTKVEEENAGGKRRRQKGFLPREGAGAGTTGGKFLNLGVLAVCCRYCQKIIDQAGTICLNGRASYAILVLNDTWQAWVPGNWRISGGRSGKMHSKMEVA